MHIHLITGTTFRWARPSIGAIAAGVMLGVMQAARAEPATKASPPNAASYFHWTGTYIGTNFGYGFGHSHTDAIFSDASLGTPLLATGSSAKFNGVLGGAQAGYNWQAGYWLLAWKSPSSTPTSALPRAMYALERCAIRVLRASMPRRASSIVRSSTGSERCAHASA